MGEKTTAEEKLPRADAAARLQNLAEQLDSDGLANVQVGNKTVTLEPASTIEYEIKIDERSPMLGGRREEITLTLEWKVEENED